MNDKAAYPGFREKRTAGIVFDMDGTLSDSIGAYLDVFEEAATTAGFHTERARVLACLSGQINIWEDLFPADLPERAAVIQKVSLATGELYAKAMIGVKLFPGVPALLRALRESNVKMAVVTASSRESLGPLFRDGLDRYFDVLISTWSDGLPRKPAPDSVLVALERMKVRPAEAVVVGDTPADVVAGRRAGALAVAVLSGVASREALERENPTVILDSVDQIPGLLGI